MAEKQKTRDILLYNFLYVIFKRKTLAIVIFFIVLIGFVFGTYLTIPMYQATTKVWIHRNPQQSIRFFGDLEIPQIPLGIVSPSQNIVQVANSREIATQIVSEFKLDEIHRQQVLSPQGFRAVFMHDFKAVLKSPIQAVRWALIRLQIIQPGKRNYFAEAVDSFLDDMADIHTEGAETEIVSMSVWSEVPELSTAISRRLSQLTVDKIQSLYTSDAEEALAFVKQEVGPAEAKLREAETAVSEYKVSTGVVSMDEEKKIRLTSFSKISGERTELLSNLKLFETKLEDVEKDLALQQKKFISLELYRDLTKKQMDYRENINSLRAKMGVLDDELTKQRSELSYLNEVDYELEKLQRDVDVRKAIYNNLRSKMEELDIQRARLAPEYELKIIDLANLPEGADSDWPDWLINIVIAIVIALALAIGLPFLFEYWDESLKNSREVEDRLDLPVVASIPEYHSRLL